MSTQVSVFADWQSLKGPSRIGTLRTSIIRNKESFCFSYEDDWLRSGEAQQIDPELHLYTGEQYAGNDSNFLSSAMTQLEYFDGEDGASSVGISRHEQQLMAPAFNI